MFWGFLSSLSKVLEHIRLPLISPYYIHDVIESLDVVKESQGCQRLISEAKDYLLLKDRRGELYCPRAQPRRSTGKQFAELNGWDPCRCCTGQLDQSVWCVVLSDVCICCLFILKKSIKSVHWVQILLFLLWYIRVCKMKSLMD